MINIMEKQQDLLASIFAEQAKIEAELYASLGFSVDEVLVAKNAYYKFFADLENLRKFKIPQMAPGYRKMFMVGFLVKMRLMKER